MKEFKESKIPLSFYYWIHNRIHEKSFKGFVTREQINIVLRMYFNIEKRMCPLITKELEILELIKEEDGYMKVKDTKKRDDIIKELEIKLGLA